EVIAGCRSKLSRRLLHGPEAHLVQVPPSSVVRYLGGQPVGDRARELPQHPPQSLRLLARFPAKSASSIPGGIVADILVRMPQRLAQQERTVFPAGQEKRATRIEDDLAAFKPLGQSRCRCCVGHRTALLVPTSVAPAVRRQRVLASAA